MSKRKDKLEEFVNQNRRDFDQQSAPNHLWEKIHGSINETSSPNKKQSNSIVKWIGGIAAAVLIFFIGASSNIFTDDRSSAIYNTSPSLSDYSPEYKEVESFYQEELKVKLAKLTNFEPDTIIHQDMAELEEIYGELKKELARSPESTKEQVVEAMIENYKTRIQILEMVLERLEDSEKRKKSGDVPIRM